LVKSQKLEIKEDRRYSAVGLEAFYASNLAVPKQIPLLDNQGAFYSMLHGSP
jgi:hypothetical protein